MLGTCNKGHFIEDGKEERLAVRIIQGDCREILGNLEPNSVHCVVTSPPYWGLREYSKSTELGYEPSPQEWTSNLVGVFGHVKRVLRGDGTLWVNVGDAYVGGNNMNIGGIAEKFHTHGADEIVRATDGKRSWKGLRRKNLLGLPWRLAFALQNDGWFLRNDAVWVKPNAMVSGVEDRLVPSHEYLFLLTKSQRYYFDWAAIEEPAVGGGTRRCRDVWNISTRGFKGNHTATFPDALVEPCIKAGTSESGCCSNCGTPIGRIVRRVKCEANDTKGYARSLGGTSHGLYNRGGFKNGTTETIGWSQGCECTGAGIVPCVVLDPMAGTGTTGRVAQKLGRDSIMIDASEEYCDMMAERTSKGEL